MYKGTRDAHLTIKVPMELCYATEFSSDTWIEIMIPPRDFKTSKELWESFVVKPEQVCWLDESNNLIEGINAHTAITCCQHYNDNDGKRRTVAGSENTKDPYDIIRQIEWYIYEKNK